MSISWVTGQISRLSARSDVSPAVGVGAVYSSEEVLPYSPGGEAGADIGEYTVE